MITVRQLHRDQSGVIEALFAGLSARSRYLRFHTAVPRLTSSMRTRLLDVDGIDRLALVAEAGDVPVGIARLARTAPREAEVAVAVVDSWHRHGIGRRLVAELADHAAELGLDRLHALVLPENAAALALFRTVFAGARSRYEDGAVRVEWLVPSLAPLTATDVLADLVC